jgi:hypothetical protein
MTITMATAASSPPPTQPLPRTCQDCRMIPFFYYAWTLPHSTFLFYITLSIALHHYLRRCFTSWEGLDIACFSDAQLRCFTPRSLGPHGRAVGSMLLAFATTTTTLTVTRLQRHDDGDATTAVAAAIGDIATAVTSTTAATCRSAATATTATQGRQVTRS